MRFLLGSFFSVRRAMSPMSPSVSPSLPLMVSPKSFSGGHSVNAGASGLSLQLFRVTLEPELTVPCSAGHPFQYACSIVSRGRRALGGGAPVCFGSDESPSLRLLDSAKTLACLLFRGQQGPTKVGPVLGVAGFFSSTVFSAMHSMLASLDLPRYLGAPMWCLACILRTCLGRHGAGHACRWQVFPNDDSVRISEMMSFSVLRDNQNNDEIQRALWCRRTTPVYRRYKLAGPANR